MNKFFTILLPTAAAIVIQGCANYDMAGMLHVQSPEVNSRFEESMNFNKADGARTISCTTDSYKVYVGTDMHIDTKATTAHTDRFLTDFREDENEGFAIILGDLVNTNENIPKASARVREMAGEKEGKVFFTLGNHDVYFGQWKDWSKEWGTSTYTLEVSAGTAKDLFICLDSADGLLGTRQLAWFKETLKNAKGYRHTFVFTHTHPFKKDGSQGHTSNYPMEETYELTGLLGEAGVDLFLCGHDHAREVTHFNGVEYIIVDALEEHYGNAAYMILNVGESLSYKFIGID